MDRRRYKLASLYFLVLLSFLAGCHTVGYHRKRADTRTYRIIEEKQQEAMGKVEPLVVESPADTLRRRLIVDQNLPHSTLMSLGIHDLVDDGRWTSEKHILPGREDPIPWNARDELSISLVDALKIGARNSREYQTAKEDVFLSALALDLARDGFRNTFAGLLSSTFEHEGEAGDDVSGVTNTGDGTATRLLKNGAELSARIAVDLVKLITQDKASSFGILADASVSIPLLRGSGKWVVGEPLTQADRGVLYAIYDFERFKKTFAVAVVQEYLSVLRSEQEVINGSENYGRLIAATRRARRLADSGKIPEFQFDQAIQDELRARNRWIRSRQAYAGALDAFKLTLGLPPDANITLENGEFETVRELVSSLAHGEPMADYSGKVPPADAPVELKEPDRKNAGPLEMDPAAAVKLAMGSRLDLRRIQREVEDAERGVLVAADALRMELTLLGSASVGERRTLGNADQDDASFALDEADFSALLNLDLPLERAAERAAYRASIITLERAVRGLQELEDRIKLEVRNRLRGLLESRESLQIQAQAEALAKRRVNSTDLFLQAGRAEIRDVLEAEEALLTAQNAVTSAMVDYRIAELELQRDLGVLTVDGAGLFQEYIPKGE